MPKLATPIVVLKHIYIVVVVIDFGGGGVTPSRQYSSPVMAVFRMKYLLCIYCRHLQTFAAYFVAPHCKTFKDVSRIELWLRSIYRERERERERERVNQSIDFTSLRF